MHILMTGGTGYIGTRLCAKLDGNGTQISVFTRNINAAKNKLPNRIQCIDDLQKIKHLPPIDAVINLAGHPIANARWSPGVKKKIIDSRILLTRNLLETLQQSQHRPKILLSGSAVGYYGLQADKTLTEDDPSGTGFAAQLCRDWEVEALKAKALGMRVCCIRTGLVLGKSGGLLKRMRIPFLLGLGGKIGTGKQWMSWIHIEDYLNILINCLDNPQVTDCVNATAPNPVTNEEFTKTLAKTLNRPAIFPVPAMLLKVMLGEMADELLIHGQRVIPQKCLDAGFHFHYPNLEDALLNIERG